MQSSCIARTSQPRRCARFETLLALEPNNPGYNNLKAAILARIGEFQQTIEIYAAVLAAYPQQPKIWMSYGHALKTKGREEDSIAAYAKSIELLPDLGEAYWSLANLKDLSFHAGAVDAIACAAAARRSVGRESLSPCILRWEGARGPGDYAASFEHYAHGNRMRRSMLRYAPEELTAHVRRSKALLTREFLSEAQRLRGCGAGSHSSLWGYRARAQRSSSRCCRAIRKSKARWNCPISLQLRKP